MTRDALGHGQRVEGARERPILMSAPMVRAVLDGTKTQTRRVVKGIPAGVDLIEPLDGYPGEFRFWRNGEPQTSILCPYGVPGDRLWVRETWQRATDFGYDTDHFFYRATYTNGGVYDDVAKWRPSIFMPRAASRITLEITDVRVERLQDISEEDADAECFGGNFPHVVLPHLFQNRDEAGALTLPQCYGVLWDSINGAGAWDANPWVWALTFRRLP